MFFDRNHLKCTDGVIHLDISHYWKPNGVDRIRSISKACRSISDKVYYQRLFRYQGNRMIIFEGKRL
ncbi:MAG: hypothetical protein BECKG1743D_GA0114223_108813 [Candidatus Kentron sp. G]|nr:MAG: hypothetical protein BECKG1743F_GA0114225_102644 [Candidatus Kentron sp. G]VFM99245.1 MAG: hypothetical protein BECKG1743E_GA0114224_102444 [Candidatus Kentron sp. G]VFN06551.1 MAG: hypothetical protein BECKG1743D_GA0114223_108813 [Candidatus Kentron sp. G]